MADDAPDADEPAALAHEVEDGCKRVDALMAGVMHLLEHLPYDIPTTDPDGVAGPRLVMLLLMVAEHAEALHARATRLRQAVDRWTSAVH